MFADSYKRSKKKKLKLLVSHFTNENLAATEASLVRAGKRKAAQVFKLAITSSPKSLKKMEQARSSVNIVAHSAEEALGRIVDLN